ncbi:MAG: nicotinate-nucleotide adenylyltransferase [Gammaproteobacteria bacterium]|nr:nicotinate-nucleotide adenylyltransferase [Gammaproteobacteria bacterium]
MIGIFGGTFDPVHYGHLRPVQEVCDDLDLDEVRWIPCGLPPHRDPPKASAQDRLEMLSLAVKGNASFVVDTREVDRNGPSYMVDTLESLRHDFPDESLVLILGQDAFNSLPEWHRWQEILQLAHIVVCTRPGSELASSGQLVELVSERGTQDISRLKDEKAGVIYMHDVIQLPISSTQIRDLCLQGKSHRYLLPLAVNEYIQTNGLYQKDR